MPASPLPLLLRAAAVATFACSAGSAAAQNGYSFLDADKSAVDYRLATVQPATACAELRRLSDSTVTITMADTVAAAGGVPAFCRVRGVIAPEIQFEVLLPARWNRRFYMHGNGGFAGESLDNPFRLQARLAALRHGFVAATTNTGHDSDAEPLGTFAYRNLQKQIDYAYRAVHLTAVTAKRVIHAYYDRPQSFSYWDGCSTGGRQGLMSAQRYPGDFDGIVAGAPVLDFTGIATGYAWNAQALRQTPIKPEKLKTLGDAVIKHCDAKDGATDGLIADPRRCDFDAARDVPKCAAGADTAACFTEGEIDTLKKIYAGPSVDGQRVFFGQPLSAEAYGADFLTGKAVSGWDFWIVSARGPSRQVQYGETFMRYFAFPQQDPSADWLKFDFAKDPPRMAAMRRMLNASDPDLSAFAKRGGKMITYFGWADSALNPLMGIDYYEKATAKTAGLKDAYRLFMAPGVFHCRGGYGPDRIDALTAVINWVERGTAPDTLTATKAEGDKIVRTRPLCPHPMVAKYKGSGSMDEAASFECGEP